MQAIENKILSRIYGHGRGWAFTASDFTHELKRAMVDWTFHRLVGEGQIRRVARGVYDCPIELFPERNSTTSGMRISLAIHA